MCHRIQIRKCASAMVVDQIHMAQQLTCTPNGVRFRLQSMSLCLKANEVGLNARPQILQLQML